MRQDEPHPIPAARFWFSDFFKVEEVAAMIARWFRWQWSPRAHVFAKWCEEARHDADRLQGIVDRWNAYCARRARKQNP